MIRLNNIKLCLDYTDNSLIDIASKKLKINKKHISNIKLFKRSVDARVKNDVHFLASIDVYLNNSIDEKQAIIKSKCKNAGIVENNPYIFKKCSNINRSVVVVGAGPAGLFAGYTLAKAGIKPIIIERGSRVEKRITDIENFHKNGVLNTESNVQFGEGGAGTFSDGKLNTGIKDARIRTVLELFNKFGANDEILWQAKPHIGTDILRKVIVNMRNEIIALGGEFRFDEKVEKLNIINNRIESVDVSKDSIHYTLKCDYVVLAIGHSARDTFYSLKNSNINMIKKPFAVGVRIEHSQAMINKAQYGEFYNHKALSAADYKLAVHLPEGRGVYTFCMCPGGYVVAAASEENMVATNGMSNFARDGKNANSALLVGVDVEDIKGEDVLSGIEFQREIERRAFLKGGGNYSAPAETLGSFLYNDENTLGNITPTYSPSVNLCGIDGIFPKFITDSLKSGILLMDKKINGFADKNAIITAPETRSSSPVRILRNKDYQSDIKGLFPCGEGAGYAGGITSAAVDGIKCAESIIDNIT